MLAETGALTRTVTRTVAGTTTTTVSAASRSAAAAGLRDSDVITRLGDTAVDGANALVAAIAALRPGDRVAATVRRAGSTLRRTVTLGTQPKQPMRP